MTRNRIVLAFLLSLIAISHSNAQTYVVVNSTLVHRNVSDSYASAVYEDILEGVKCYLADSSTEHLFYRGVDSGIERDRPRENRFYRGDDNEIDIDAGGTHILLDLYCEIIRQSNELLLTVLINGNQTQKSYLSFDVTVPFFRPEAAVAHFSNTFPERFNGRLVWECSYPASPEGFHLGGGDLILGNVRYEQNLLFLSYPDFNYDLARTEDLPAEIRKDFKRFQTVQTITAVTFWISYPTFLTVAIGAMFGDFPGEISASTGWTIFGISAALTLCTTVAANLNRSKNVSNLRRIELDQ